ncbi:MAG: phosphoribosylamine--glycine ligase [Myxococcota bacterium]
MRVLVLGGGGREHALCWAIARSPRVAEVVCAPGSPGIALDARVTPVRLEDPQAVLSLARRELPDLVVVGPEAPLAAGVADRLRSGGLRVFGPSRAAARLESSKIFAKEFMARHKIPTARARHFDDAEEAERWVREQGRPLVVKADGLAAGKGVAMCETPELACRAIDEAMREQRFGAAGGRLLIEEWLHGEEASFTALCDGEGFACLPSAQDHKRALEGDRGENTGGMGAYSPTPVLTAQVSERVLERIVRPTVAGMRAEGCPFRGALYVGLMIDREGDPRVVEFNVRFGDPEIQAILFRLESDWLPLLLDAADGRLPADPDAGQEPRFGDPAVCVVLASEGYPRAYPTGRPISGLDAVAELESVKVFHAGTTRDAQGRWLTAGGRVLGVTARGPTFDAARARAYDAADRIHFDGRQLRRDIATRALA